MTDPFARIRALFGKPAPEAHAQVRQIAEFLDMDHPRASLPDGDRMVIDAGRSLENIRAAMERVDLDINTAIAINDDVIPIDELMAMVRHLMMGPTLVVEVVNTAMRIMSNRYPAELVTRPLPPEFDLRQLVPLDISEEHHEIARSIFNQRTASAEDLEEVDVQDRMADLGDDQAQIFIALFFMYCAKVGALKYTTGVE